MYVLKIRESYSRIRSADNMEASRMTQIYRPHRMSYRTDPQQLLLSNNSASSGGSPRVSRRAYYRCSYCSLVTHIRTDMRHHLMRELHYKPFTCGYCAYTEPSRSGMGKHFWSKHCGLVIDIRDLSDPDTDAKVLIGINCSR